MEVFVKRYGWLLMLLLMLLLGGCGQKAVPGQQPAKQELQQKGTLVLGGLQEPDTLNPLLSELSATNDLGRLLFSGLVVMDDQGRWQPDLATVVPTVQNGGISRDGLTVTYRLRPDVTWHDGVAFTAEDVRFTWQLISQNKVHPYWKELYSRVASVEAPDRYTVVVKFKSYDPRQLALFQTILPQHRLGGSRDLAKDAFQRQPVGTGPFRLKEWRMAEAVVLEANERYYRGKPKINTILYRVIPESTLMVALLKSGEVDVVGNIPLQNVDHVRSAENMKLVLTPSTIWEHVDLNNGHPLFSDVRVRRALSLGLDRQAVVNAGIRNTGFPAAVGMPPQSWLAQPEIKAPGRDLAAAKELLQQAGWKPGPNGWLLKDGQMFSFVMYIPAKDKIRENVASQVAQQWRDLGIKVEVQPVDIRILKSDILKNRRYTAALYGWIGELSPWLYDAWHSAAIPGAANGYSGLNFSGFRNAELDGVLGQLALPQVDEQQRAVAWRAQEILNDEVPVITLYFRAQVDAVKPRVVNFKPNPSMSGNYWNAWEWSLSGG